MKGTISKEFTESTVYEKNKHDFLSVHEGAFCHLFVRLSSATSFEPISGNFDMELG